MSRPNSSLPRPTRSLLLMAALLMLLLSGLTLALSWAVTFPALILISAGVVALAALVVVVLAAVMDSRRQGKGFWATIWRSFKTLVSFVFWFF